MTFTHVLQQVLRQSMVAQLELERRELSPLGRALVHALWPRPATAEQHQQQQLASLARLAHEAHEDLALREPQVSTFLASISESLLARLPPLARVALRS